MVIFHNRCGLLRKITICAKMPMFTCIDQSFQLFFILCSGLKCCVDVVLLVLGTDSGTVSCWFPNRKIFWSIFLWNCFYYYLLISFFYLIVIAPFSFLWFLYAAKYILNILCLHTLVAMCLHTLVDCYHLWWEPM